jgi:CDP-glucose 4,6-dehydratase
MKTKNILIFGSEGFVGHHLTQFFQKRGYRVLCTSHRKKPGIIYVNILSNQSVHNIFKNNHIDVCFHLAGISQVESGQKNPYSTMKTNIIGTLNILEYCRKYNIPKIIIASTAHVYGKAPTPTSESEMPQPTRPYETSKTCCDLIALSYAHTYHMPVIIPRFANIYGPGDMNIHRIIPKTILSILRGYKPELWGGDAIREYLYIEDVLHAYFVLFSTDCKDTCGVINFGSNEKISSRELTEVILKLTNSKLSIKYIRSKRFDEVIEQRMNSNKAKRMFDWVPSCTLKEGLSKTILWYKKNYHLFQ